MTVGGKKKGERGLMDRGESLILIPPRDEDLQKYRGHYMNLFGYAERYLKGENILKRYTADLLFRYVQLQLNELSEKLGKHDHMIVHEVRVFMSEMQKSLSDLKEGKEK